MPDTTHATLSSSATLQLADLLSDALRTLRISQVLVGSGAIGSLGVGNIELGEATIDRLIVQNASATLQAGSAFLQNVRFALELRLSVEWWYDIKIWDDSGTNDLGSLSFAMNIGNVSVPSLHDISVAIPQATVNGAQAHIEPVVNLDLGSATFSDVKANGTELPSAGFGLTGLGLGSVTVSEIGVPGTSTKSATVAEFKPRNPLHLPAIEVTGVQVPSTNVPQIVSTGAVNVQDAQATARGVSLNLGVLGFTFWVTPVVDLSIEALTLSDIALALAVDKLRVEGVSAPLVVKGVSIGDLALEQVTVKQISL